MRSMRRVGVWAATVVVVAGAAGCGGDDGGGSGKGAASKPAASSSAPAMSVDEALDAYQGIAAGGCTTAPSCQELMEGKLRAAKDLRVALAAEDRAGFAEPIRLVRQAERLAEHYGPEGLGSKGGFAAVNAPLQQAVEWLATNR